ncbi:hypothetical protein [Luteimonas lutimaris]|uniref:hypothetical protein n=1 Tax=Luteimonas lutimaris TaxID=698645 RepID=UPI0031D3BCF1
MATHAGGPQAPRSGVLRPAIVVALLAAALGGGLVGHRLADHRGATDAPASAADATPARGESRPAPPRPPLQARVPAPVGDNLGLESTRALNDPAYLRELIARHAGETDPDRRGALLAVLESAANDQVMAYALQLADASDPQSRQDGLRLLQAFPLDRAPVRELLLRQIDEESDPAMLRQLVDGLTPAVLPVEDTTPVAARLAQLRSHPDPGVRASSLLQSTQWDHQADMEQMLYEAMLDPAPQVREAAAAGVTSTLVHSTRLKTALLEMAGDTTLSADARSAAVFALQGFALDRDEYALFKHLAAETGPAASEAGHGH